MPLDKAESIRVILWNKKRYGDNKHRSIPVYVYLRNDYKLEEGKYNRYTTFEGFSTVKDFYATRPEREDYIPDRNERQRTLYWNPTVKTDNAGKVHIRFYNNHFCRKINISAEGLTKEGIPVCSP